MNDTANLNKQDKEALRRYKRRNVRAAIIPMTKMERRWFTQLAQSTQKQRIGEWRAHAKGKLEVPTLRERAEAIVQVRRRLRQKTKAT